MKGSIPGLALCHALSFDTLPRASRLNGSPTLHGRKRERPRS